MTGGKTIWGLGVLICYWNYLLNIIFGNWLGVVDECINININSDINVRIKTTVLMLGSTAVLLTTVLGLAIYSELTWAEGPGTYNCGKY